MSENAGPQPITVGLALTGLHVIHIVEYARAYGIDIDHLIVQDASLSPRTLRWSRTACTALGTPEPVLLACTIETNEHDREVVAGLLGDPARPVRVISGGIHAPLLWRLVHDLGDGLAELIVVDEGVGTFTSPIGDRNAVPREVQAAPADSDWATVWESFRDRPATLHSRFPLTGQLGPQDTLAAVDPAVLPKVLHLDGATGSEAIYVVGAPLDRLLKAPDLDATLTCVGVGLLKQHHVGVPIVYIPHRDEGPDKLAVLSHLVEVRPLEHPIELEALLTGVAPKRLATFNSSAVIELGMADPEVTVDHLAVPTSMYIERFVEPLEKVAELYALLLGAKVTTVPIPEDPGPALAAAGLETLQAAYSRDVTALTRRLDALEATRHEVALTSQARLARVEELKQDVRERNAQLAAYAETVRRRDREIERLQGELAAVQIEAGGLLKRAIRRGQRG